MLEFLASFLLLLFSFNAAVNNDQGQPIAFEKLQDNLSTISTTPVVENLVVRLEKKEQKLIDHVLPLDNGNQESHKNEEHEKVEAYNTQSEKVIGSVSSSGVEHSPVIVPCSEIPELCNSYEPEVPSVTSEPPLIPPKPEPDPIVIDPPKPIDPPEPIDPIVIPVPPEKPPQDPCGCTPGKDIYCIMLYPCREIY